MFYYIFINDVSDSDGDDGNTNYNLIEGRNGNIFSKAIAEHAWCPGGQLALSSYYCIY